MTQAKKQIRKVARPLSPEGGTCRFRQAITCIRVTSKRFPVVKGKKDKNFYGMNNPVKKLVEKYGLIKNVIPCSN